MFCLIPAPKCLDTFGIIYAAALPCSILTYAKSYKVTNARDPQSKIIANGTRDCYYQGSAHLIRLFAAVFRALFQAVFPAAILLLANRCSRTSRYSSIDTPTISGRIAHLMSVHFTSMRLLGEKPSKFKFV